MSNFTQELVKRGIITDRRVRQLESRQTPVRGGSEATITSGAITASKAYHRLLPETGTTDTLTTITPPFDSKFLLLRTLIPGHTITIQTGTGNLELSGGDCTLDDPTDSLYVMWDDKLGAWIEVSRAPVGGKQYATFVIAASDSTDADKANADWVCDGTADQTEINLALAATTPSTYQRVLLLEGTYAIAATITMTANSVLEGQGDATKLTPTANSFSVITAADNSTVTNLKLDSLATTGTSAFEANGVTDFKVDNCTVVGFPNYGVNIHTGSEKIHVYDCRFYGDGSGVYAVYADACDHIQVVDCYFDDCGEAVWLDVSNHNLIVANKMINCGYGVDLGGSDNTISGNNLYAQGSVGINLYDGGFNTVTGNVLRDYDQGIVFDTITRSVISSNTCRGDGSANGSTGIDLTNGSNYNIVDGNVCTDFSSEGILLDNADHNIVSNNYLIGNSWSNNTNPGLNPSAGIGLVLEADYNFITNNIIRKSSPGSSNFQSYGVRISSSNCNDNLILNNDLRDAGYTSGVLNSGTSTRIIGTDGAIPQQTLTLATDAVTVSASGYYTILPQSGTADDMITINGGTDGMIIYVRAETASHVITVKETGNINLISSQFRMVGRDDFLMLIYDGDQSKWIELNRSKASVGYNLTIASGVVTVHTNYHTLTPETGATDDLDTINGGVDGQLLVVQAAATKTVTLKDSTGNLDLNGDFVMVDTDDKIIILTYNGTGNTWVELYRSGTADIADGYVTFAKMQDISSDRLIGRDLSGSGVPTEISLGASLEFSGSNSIQRAALTGDVTASANSNATTIPNDTVTNAKMANMAESTIKGRAAGAGTGDPTDLTVAQVLTMLGISSSLHAFYSFTANTAGGGDTTLDSYTVGAGQLVADGDTLWFEAFGTFANNANVKTLKVNFGSSGVSQIFSQSSVFTNVDWSIKGRVMRTSGTSQKASVTFVAGSTFTTDYTSGLNQTLSGTVPFSVVGASSGSGDIILEGFLVGYTAAP